MINDPRLLVAGVRAAIDGRALATDQALAARAPLDSPAFTGAPTGPAPDAGDDSARLATTAWVRALTAGSVAAHTHPQSEVTGLVATLAAKADAAGLAGVATSGSYLDLADRPPTLAPQANWASPTGTGFNRGVFNTDDETAITNPPTGSQVTELQNRLIDTRAVLRALILALKDAGVLTG